MAIIVKDSTAPPSYSEVISENRVLPGAVATGPHSGTESGTRLPSVPPDSGVDASPRQQRQQASLNSPINSRKPLLAGAPHPPYTLAPSSTSSSPAARSHPILYHYQNPQTGHTISSLLPPDHPAMQCLQHGMHVPGPTHFGLLGILGAIIFFPVGLACIFFDRTSRCDRCGESLSEGCS